MIANFEVRADWRRAREVALRRAKADVPGPGGAGVSRRSVATAQPRLVRLSRYLVAVEETLAPLEAKAFRPPAYRRHHRPSHAVGRHRRETMADARYQITRPDRHIRASPRPRD